jgi:hypothetical protein
MTTEITLKATQSDIVELLINEMREDLEANHKMLDEQLADQLSVYFKDAEIVDRNIRNGIKIPPELELYVKKHKLKCNDTHTNQLMNFADLPVKFIAYGMNKMPTYGRDIHGYVETRMQGNDIKGLGKPGTNVYTGWSPFTVSIPHRIEYYEKEATPSNVDTVVTLNIATPYLNDNQRHDLTQYVYDGKMTPKVKAIIKWFKEHYGINAIHKELRSLHSMCTDIAKTMSELEAINHQVWDLQKNPGKYKAKFTKASLQKSPEGQEILKVVDELKSSDINLLNA